MRHATLRDVFGLSFGELCVLLLVAVVVFGPKELPRYLRKGGQTTGVWKDIADKEVKYQQLAKQWQNPDGSFSTDFFRGPGNASDKQLRMNSSGHILEWLALSLPDEEIKAPWVQDAAAAVALMFLDTQDQPMEGGTLYHATHGLLIYYARAFDGRKLGPNQPLVPLPPRPGEHQAAAADLGRPGK